MSVANVMKKIKSNNVKFVDFRFSDTKGKEPVGRTGFTESIVGHLSRASGC